MDLWPQLLLAVTYQNEKETLGNKKTFLKTLFISFFAMSIWDGTQRHQYQSEFLPPDWTLFFFNHLFKSAIIVNTSPSCQHASIEFDLSDLKHCLQ